MRSCVLQPGSGTRQIPMIERNRGGFGKRPLFFCFFREIIFGGLL